MTSPGDEISKINEILADKLRKAQEGLKINSENLSIKSSGVKEGSDVSFEQIYTHYANELGSTEGVENASLPKNHEVAMKEAQETYESMMDIHNELVKEFDSLKNINP